MKFTASVFEEIGVALLGLLPKIMSAAPHLLEDWKTLWNSHATSVDKIVAGEDVVNTGLGLAAGGSAGPQAVELNKVATKVAEVEAVIAPLVSGTPAQ